MQDRVIQVYEGLVYMDFSQDLMSQDGHGRYTYLSCENLPQFFLVYLPDPSDSGRIHSDVYQRWSQGDLEVVTGMQKFASLAEQAVQVCWYSIWNLIVSYKQQGFFFFEKKNSRFFFIYCQIEYFLAHFIVFNNISSTIFGDRLSQFCIASLTFIFSKRPIVTWMNRFVDSSHTFQISEFH